MLIIFSTIFAYYDTKWLKQDTSYTFSPKIEYILANPITFISLVAKFLLLKFSAFKESLYYTSNISDNYPQYFQYLLSLNIIVCAFIDKKPNDKEFTLSRRLIMILSCIFSIFIMCITIYIDYTPVGSNTIIGMQSRYWIPLLFPLLYSISSPNIINMYNKSLFASWILFIYSSMSFYMIYTLIINPLP